MVRLPKEKRESMFTFENLTIQAPNGSVIPFSTVATANLQKAPGTIESLDGAQVSYINAQPENQEVKIMEMAERLKPEIDQIVAKNQGISWIWAGYIKEQNETNNRYTWLYSLLILTLFALLGYPLQIPPPTLCRSPRSALWGDWGIRRPCHSPISLHPTSRSSESWPSLVSW